MEPVLGYEPWARPCDFTMDDLTRTDPSEIQRRAVVYCQRQRQSEAEIILKVSVPNRSKKIIVKEYGGVCHAVAVGADLEVWWEYLKDKQLQKITLPMSTLDFSLRQCKGAESLEDVGMPDSEEVTSEAYALAIGASRMRLVHEKKSYSNVWWFIQLCRQHKVNVRSLGKIGHSVFFKRGSDKSWNFEKYLESKGLKQMLTQASTVQTGSGNGGNGEPEQNADTVSASQSTSGAPSGPGSSSIYRSRQKTKATKSPVVTQVTDRRPSAWVSSRDAEAAKGVKRKTTVKVEKVKPGFNASAIVIGQDEDAKQSLVLDQAHGEEIKQKLKDLERWYPLGNFLAFANVFQLTDPLPTMVYRPCSQMHVNKTQQSMCGNNDVPLPAVVIPYRVSASKTYEFLTFITEKQLLDYIQQKGTFMVISGSHSTKAAKNIIRDVKDNIDHPFYDRSLLLKARQIRILRGDTPEETFVKLSQLANAHNATFKYESAFVE